VWQGREEDGENTVPIMLSVNCITVLGSSKLSATAEEQINM